MTESLAATVVVMLLILGISYSFQPDQWARVASDAIESPHRFLPVALILLILGLAIVFHHNVWEPGWGLVITITGWILVIKGALFLIVPNVAGAFRSWSGKSLRAFIRGAGILLTVLALLTAYYGLSAL